MTLLLTVSRSVFAFVLAKCTFGQPLKVPLQLTIRFRFTPFACTQSTMDSENVHPQRQPTLRPSLGKAQIEMRRVETTDQLLRKGDSASLLNHFQTGSTHAADGAARTSKLALPRRKINKACLAFLAGTSKGTANKIPHDVFASIAGHADSPGPNLQELPCSRRAHRRFLLLHGNGRPCHYCSCARPSREFLNWSEEGRRCALHL